MSDYSQKGEQATIIAWASGQPPGSFIDLGAYDGVSYSNTAALADLGWPGLCIDAAPDAAGACATRYARRPDIDVLLAAFNPGGGSEPATIHWTPRWMYSALIPRTGMGVEQPTPILVPCVSFAWLKQRAAELPRPLFCSIDIEGASLAALHWLLENASPACVCVEANNPSDREQVAEALADWEMLDANDVNCVYAREASP